MIFECPCDSTDIPASIYDRTIDARPFDTPNDILRCLSFVQSLFKDRNAPIWRIGNRRVKFFQASSELLKELSFSEDSASQADKFLDVLEMFETLEDFGFTSENHIQNFGFNPTIYKRSFSPGSKYYFNSLTDFIEKHLHKVWVQQIH